MVNQKPKVSASRDADFKWLHEAHGISDVMFDSLLASKKEAQAHLNFFKKMVFISNGTVMTFGLFVMGWGLREGLSEISFARGLAAMLGAAFFLWFCVVFVRGIKSVRATEYVARKHGLID